MVTHPWLYHWFSMGTVVQVRSGTLFSVIRTDIELEQTVQYSLDLVGIISWRNSRSTGTVAEFELLFYEVVAISNLMRMLMRIDGVHRMSSAPITWWQVDLCLTPSTGMFQGTVVTKVPLHNFITKQVTNSIVAARLLCLLRIGMILHGVLEREAHLETENAKRYHL